MTLSLLAATTVAAQKKTQYSTKSKKAIELFEQAQTDYVSQKLRSALQKYEQALTYDERFTEAYFMCSEIYRDFGDYEHQFENIQKAVALDSTMYVSGYYHAGVALCNLGRFAEATEWFDLYKHYAQNKRVKFNVDAWMERAMAAKQLMENPVPFNPRIVSENLQSPYDMYWPSLTLDEREIVVTMLVPRDTSAFRADPLLTRNSQNFNEDFFMSRKDPEGNWQKLQPVVSINTERNEGAQALSADGKWMFFTACGRPDSKGSCDLYFSRRTSDGWTTPVNVGAPVNTQYWESQPCFSADGQTLYFVSNRPSGHGGNDIWQATITGFAANGVPVFGSLKNLGDSINTSGDETSPFMHPDGQTIYFSSNGRLGMGGLDIYYSRRDTSGRWQRPVNIGYPINTPQDDNGLVISASGTMAYFSSIKLLGDGTRRRELLCFELPPEARPQPVSYIRGYVYDARTQQPLGAAVELINLANGKRQATALADNRDGTFILNLPSGCNYALLSECKGYLFHSQNFELVEVGTSTEPVILKIPMSPLVAGEKVAMRNVFFDTNSTALKPESYIELDRLVDIMKSNTELRIEIGGHTDNVGTAEYNKRLSDGRAQTTVDYLISKGIDGQRITHKGYGMTQPMADNDTEEGRAMNRRIEAKIVK